MFGKKGYIKSFEKGLDFLQEYAGRIHALMNFTTENATVTDKLSHLQESFVFTVNPPQNKTVKKHQQEIENKFNDLSKILQEDDWDEKEVLNRIKGIEFELGLLASVRT